MDRKICKHCKVDVISKTDTRAVLGKEHGKHCPRRNKSAAPRFQK